jgi:transcriptional regulator
MYLPEHFAVHDQQRVARFVAEAGAADFVTFDGSGLVASLLPVIWEQPGPGAPGDPGAPGGPGGTDGPDGGHGRLLAHLALANPQWRTAQASVPGLAIVHGPQAYISPGWYASARDHGRVVPTWNYTSVHFTGPVTFHRDAGWLRDIVTRLTERYEQGRDQPWRVQDAPPAFIEGQLRGIVGVEMTVTRVEAKAKLGQNRSAADRAGAISGLRAEPGSDPQAVAGLMERGQLPR